MFGRSRKSTNGAERLAREIQQRRVQVHDALAELAPIEANSAGRVYRVFASFQGDLPTRESMATKPAPDTAG